MANPKSTVRVAGHPIHPMLVPAPKGLLLSLIAVCILLFTGWKGGELVFRYRVGVLDSALGAADESPTRRAA